jgi:DNA-binding MarR family transcriptional regulator
MILVEVMHRKISDPDIIAILSLSPQSCQELARFLGQHQETIGRRLNGLVRDGKVVRKVSLKDVRVPVYTVPQPKQKEYA